MKVIGIICEKKIILKPAGYSILLAIWFAIPVWWEN